MKITLDRRTVLAGMLALPVAVNPAMVLADGHEPVLGDVVLGDAEAPVTIIEYASLTCPHCSSFHINTWPQVKEAYVDTGKVKFILREAYFDKQGLWASMTARCGGEKGFKLLEELAVCFQIFRIQSISKEILAT